MIVAKITKDYITGSDGDDASLEGKIFDYEALVAFFSTPWGEPGDDFPSGDDLMLRGETKFKLYDDDRELYYSGWLYNDPQCVVQQFVLRWAEADSGCTIIKIKKPGVNGEWVQEIG